MSKTNATKPPYTKRTGIPAIVKDREGNALLMCPFCKPSHPLQPNVTSLCGTTLVLTAEQVVIRAKYDRKLICVKCGKGGGEMVQFQQGFAHIHNCSPGVIAMTDPPKYSRLATWVHGLKNERIRNTIEKYAGQAMPVQEIDSKGVKTGVILGHFFFKKKR